MNSRDGATVRLSVDFSRCFITYSTTSLRLGKPPTSQRNTPGINSQPRLVSLMYILNQLRWRSELFRDPLAIAQNTNAADSRD
jgi:hypothetical protein